VSAVPLKNFEPGSPEWMTRMTASKVAAVLGLSPWESRFSLWQRMAGYVPPQEATDATRRGHYLEDAVATWWADQHPCILLPGGAWQHPDRSWQAASPDRLIVDTDNPTSSGIADALLEVKTTAVDDEWGAAGTDEIPPYYRAQVVWQLDTLGLQTAYVAVLLPRLEFREYVIQYKADEAAYIRGEAKAFLDSLPGGPDEQRPDLDGHAATYVAVRALNPDIEQIDVDLPHPLAREYCEAVKGLRAAQNRHDLARVEIADFMGTARRALWDGRSIATRRASRSGDPYVQAAARLPEFEDVTA